MPRTELAPTNVKLRYWQWCMTEWLITCQHRHQRSHTETPTAPCSTICLYTYCVTHTDSLCDSWPCRYYFQWWQIDSSIHWPVTLLSILLVEFVKSELECRFWQGVLTRIWKLNLDCNNELISGIQGPFKWDSRFHANKCYKSAHHQIMQSEQATLSPIWPVS